MDSNPKSSHTIECASDPAIIEYEIDPNMKEFLLLLTLEEVLNGCTKRFKFPSLDGNGQVHKGIQLLPGCEERIYKVPEGFIKGYKFEKLVIKCEKHPIFQRSGVDIYYEKKLSEEEVKKGDIDLKVPTLDGTTIRLQVNYQKQTYYTLTGLGLPFSNYPNKRGNLVVSLSVDESTKTRIQDGSDKAKDETFKEKDLNAKELTKTLLKDPLLEVPIRVTLEELMTGCTKDIVFPRKSFISGQPYTETVDYSVQVKPGWKSGARITYPDDGHQCSANSLPGDLVFVIDQLPHPHFTRHGDDIHHTVTLKSNTPLVECKVLVPSPDPNKAEMEVSLKRGESCVRLAGLGMPHPKQPSKRGDFVVNFCIELS